MRVPLLILLVLGSSLACSHPQSTLTRCKSNLKNVATALEMYSTDNSGRYPTRLAALCPNYLLRIPECPAAQKDTYTQSYASTQIPDQFAVYCSGRHHALPPNLPAFDSNLGLVEQFTPSSKAGCEQNVRIVERKIEAHRQKHGSYPKQLADMKSEVPHCPSNAAYYYERRGKTYAVSCGGPLAHMAEGVQPFQPSYTPEGGLVARSVPPSPPSSDEPKAPEATSRIIAACAVISALLALVALTRRR